MKYTKEYLKENKIAIRCDNKNEAELIFGLFKGHDCDWTHENDCFYPDDACGAIFFREVDCESDGLIVMRASEVIEASKPKRKLKGYKYPFETYFGEKVDKDLLISEGNNNYSICVKGTHYFIPSEIVEQFEPVYEEEKPKHMIGSFSELIDYFKDTAHIVIKKGEYIAVTDSVTESKKKREYYFYINKMNDYGFTDSFQSELKELGIKI